MDVIKLLGNMRHHEQRSLLWQKRQRCEEYVATYYYRTINDFCNKDTLVELDKVVRLSNILYPNEPEYLTVLILSFNNEQERIYKTFAKGKYHTHKKQEHK